MRFDTAVVQGIIYVYR